MNEISGAGRALVAAAACAPLVAMAQGPTFNCTKVQGEVETLICRDAELAALDRRLAAAYKAVQAQAKGRAAQRLRSEQVGWVKGRNECWKANGQPTWITATWTVDSVKGCVDAQYRLRTSELQAVWRLLPPHTVRFACQDNPANEVVANFFETDPPTIRLERGDRTVTMWRVGAPGAGTYEGPNVGLVHQGGGLKVDWLDSGTGKTEALQCNASR